MQELWVGPRWRECPPEATNPREARRIGRVRPQRLTKLRWHRGRTLGECLKGELRDRDVKRGPLAAYGGAWACEGGPAYTEIATPRLCSCAVTSAAARSPGRSPPDTEDLCPSLCAQPAASSASSAAARQRLIVPAYSSCSASTNEKIAHAQCRGRPAGRPSQPGARRLAAACSALGARFDQRREAASVRFVAAASQSGVLTGRGEVPLLGEDVGGDAVTDVEGEEAVGTTAAAAIIDAGGSRVPGDTADVVVAIPTVSGSPDSSNLVWRAEGDGGGGGDKGMP